MIKDYFYHLLLSVFVGRIKVILSFWTLGCFSSKILNRSKSAASKILDNKSFIEQFLNLCITCSKSNKIGS